MTWAKLDDSFPEHPKIDALTDGAFRLHVAAICWSCKLLTDGYIPADRVSRLAPRYKPVLLDELLAIDIWVPAPGGWSIPGYLNDNPPASTVLAGRALAQQRARLRRDDTLDTLILRDGLKCRYCDTLLGGRFPPPHIEHLTPLARGGTNDLVNLGLSCPACNARKGTLTEEEFVLGGNR